MTTFLSARPRLVVSGDSGTSIPADNAEGFNVRDANEIRTFIDFTGTVTSCVIRKLTKNRTTGRWHADVSTADLDPLVGSSGGDTIRVWDVYPHDEVTFQILSIVGGGSVAVYASISGE